MLFMCLFLPHRTRRMCVMTGFISSRRLEVDCNDTLSSGEGKSATFSHTFYFKAHGSLRCDLWPPNAGCDLAARSGNRLWAVCRNDHLAESRLTGSQSDVPVWFPADRVWTCGFGLVAVILKASNTAGVKGFFFFVCFFESSPSSK